MDNTAPLLLTVPFPLLREWGAKQFFFSKINSKYKIENLGAHLIHQTSKMQLSNYPDDDFEILGVSNKVGMFDASIEKGNKIKQKYHIVENNWLAYNPYRINVGSIGIKTSKLKGRYISPAYVVFSCKETLLPEFLLLMMKCGTFNSLIKDSTTGSVRQILQFERLANIKAPIPSIAEQHKLLEAYSATLAEADKNIAAGNQFSEGLLLDIQSEVSDLKPLTQRIHDSSSLLQFVPFAMLDRWEVGSILKEGRLDSVFNSFKYDSHCISELQEESLFGLSVKASPTQKDGMIPVLRMSNVVNGEIDFSELKYLPLKYAVTEKEPDKWLLRDGDYLVTRTNGSKDLVGKAAVFHSNEIYTYASYLIRYRFNTEIVLPEYVNILFMTPIVREQVAVMRRQGGGQYNLNSDEIGSIKIPVPPIPKQKAIIEKYYSAKDGANKYYEKAQALKEKAATNFEKAIFA